MTKIALMVSPSPLKYGRKRFSKKLFSWGPILCGKFTGGLFYMGEIMTRTYQGGRDSQNVFFSNLNFVNLKIFTNHGGIFT